MLKNIKLFIWSKNDIIAISIAIKIKFSGVNPNKRFSQLNLNNENL